MAANTHHTKLKGDIAVAAVILDLTKKKVTLGETLYLVEGTQGLEKG